MSYQHSGAHRTMTLAHDEYKDEKCERHLEHDRWHPYCGCAERALAQVQQVMLEHKLHLERKDLEVAALKAEIERLKLWIGGHKVMKIPWVLALMVVGWVAIIFLALRVPQTKER